MRLFGNIETAPERWGQITIWGSLVLIAAMTVLLLKRRQWGSKRIWGLGVTFGLTVFSLLMFEGVVVRKYNFHLTMYFPFFLILAGFLAGGLRDSLLGIGQKVVSYFLLFGLIGYWGYKKVNSFDPIEIQELKTFLNRTLPKTALFSGRDSLRALLPHHKMISDDAPLSWYNRFHGTKLSGIEVGRKMGIEYVVATNVQSDNMKIVEPVYQECLKGSPGFTIIDKMVTRTFARDARDVVVCKISWPLVAPDYDSEPVD